MERQALLIASVAAPANQPRIYDDLHVFRDFLCSPLGGSWHREEVAVFERPEPDQIKAAIHNARMADYALVLVQASGEEARRSRPWPEVRVKIGESAMDEQEFNPGGARVTLIFDCVGARGPSADFKEYEDSPIDRARTLYTEAIRGAEGGLVKMFASKTEGVSSLSRAMIEAAHHWQRTAAGVLNLYEISGRMQAMQRDGAAIPQVKYSGGRRMKDFPFCVS